MRKLTSIIYHDDFSASACFALQPRSVRPQEALLQGQFHSLAGAPSRNRATHKWI